MGAYDIIKKIYGEYKLAKRLKLTPFRFCEVSKVSIRPLGIILNNVDNIY